MSLRCRPLKALESPAGAEIEEMLSPPPVLRKPSPSLWECRLCSTSLGARKALGSKFSRGNLTIFWDLIQRPFTNWKRFRWTICEVKAQDTEGYLNTFFQCQNGLIIFPKT